MQTESQKTFDFDQLRLRSQGAACGLSPIACEVLCFLWERGERFEHSGHRCSRLTISKRQAQTALRCSANGFVNATRSLERRQLLTVMDLHSPFTYVVSWTLVNQLEPPEDVPETAPIFPDELPNRAKVVSGWSVGGQSPSCACVKSISTPRVFRNSACDRPQGPIDHDTPWQVVTDHQVRDVGNSRLRDQLFAEAVAAGWLEESHEARRRFFALWHHAAHLPSKYNAAATLQAQTKKGQFRFVGEVSWRWSAAQMSALTAALPDDPELAAARRLVAGSLRSPD